MRFRFEPAAEQRAALQAQLERLRDPAAVWEVLRSSVPAASDPTSVACSVQRVHDDRFVMRVGLRSDGGEERAYALKVYADDFGGRVWAHARALAAHHWPGRNGLCLPIRYVPEERMLIFPWIDGPFLGDIADERTPELLRQAAGFAASLHRLAVMPESPTTPAVLLEEAHARFNCLRARWPETTPVIEPVMAAIAEAATDLDPAEPAPVHGDLGVGQFVWTGDRLVVIDLDMFGYTDPAYDAGHFLGQLERRCVSNATPPADAARWLGCFREAYLAAMPRVSPRNVSFYQGLTLARKILTICRSQAPGWPRLVLSLATRARAALEAAVSPALPR